MTLRAVHGTYKCSHPQWTVLTHCQHRWSQPTMCRSTCHCQPGDYLQTMWLQPTRAQFRAWSNINTQRSRVGLVPAATTGIHEVLTPSKGRWKECLIHECAELVAREAYRTVRECTNFLFSTRVVLALYKAMVKNRLDSQVMNLSKSVRASDIF